MHDILQCMTVFCSLPQHNAAAAVVPVIQEKSPVHEVRDNCGTQTEIIAVHTPQVDNPPFPFNNKLQRPSTLPLDSTETSPLPHDLTNSDESNGENIEAATYMPDVTKSQELFEKIENSDNLSSDHQKNNEENQKDLILNKEEQQIE